MPTLLDTHAWLWWVAADKRLSASARVRIGLVLPRLHRLQRHRQVAVGQGNIDELGRAIEWPLVAGVALDARRRELLRPDTVAFHDEDEPFGRQLARRAGLQPLHEGRKDDGAGAQSQAFE